jgi:hypothetical protein
MKKLITLSLVTIGLLSFSINLEANCSGTSGIEPAIFSGTEEVTEGWQQALANCCAGSVIYWFDFDANAGGAWIIGSNGSNSSCGENNEL